MQYLGFNIGGGGGGDWPVQDKVKALARTASPDTHKELQQFFGLANYYRCFVPHLSSTTAPLTDLLKDDGKASKPVDLNSNARRAFLDIKPALCKQTALHTPLPNQPYVLYLDTSSTRLEAVLAQNSSQGE